jgi:hypothetical protein
MLEWAEHLLREESSIVRDISTPDSIRDISYLYISIVSYSIHTHSLLYFPVFYVQIIYRRLKYQLKANWCVSGENGLGTSLNPGLATGCLKYTAAQIL